MGLPQGWLDRPQQRDVVVIDDLFEEVNNNAVAVNQLFTKIARHRQVTVLFLTQNLFHIKVVSIEPETLTRNIW